MRTAVSCPRGRRFGWPLSRPGQLPIIAATLMIPISTTCTSRYRGTARVSLDAPHRPTDVSTWEAAGRIRDDRAGVTPVGWANGHIARLQRGETVSFRPRGNSMKGRID